MTSGFGSGDVMLGDRQRLAWLSDGPNELFPFGIDDWIRLVQIGRIAWLLQIQLQSEGF